eukprot:2862882-Rhodomonas_salina.3
MMMMTTGGGDDDDVRGCEGMSRADADCMPGVEPQHLLWRGRCFQLSGIARAHLRCDVCP